MWMERYIEHSSIERISCIWDHKVTRISSWYNWILLRLSTHYYDFRNKSHHVLFFKNLKYFFFTLAGSIKKITNQSTKLFGCLSTWNLIWVWWSRLYIGLLGYWAIKRLKFTKFQLSNSHEGLTKMIKTLKLCGKCSNF